MALGPLKKPEGISWNAASVELPEIPMLPPGPDAMSATISAVLPTLAAQLTANVAALQAKEHTYSGKVGDAQAAYAASDESGSQSVGQVVGMLGKLGEQAGQLAGAPSQAAQGGSGMFGSLIEQVMKAAEGGGGGEAGQRPAGGAPVGAAPVGVLRRRVRRVSLPGSRAATRWKSGWNASRSASHGKIGRRSSQCSPHRNASPCSVLTTAIWRSDLKAAGLVRVRPRRATGVNASRRRRRSGP